MAIKYKFTAFYIVFFSFLCCLFSCTTPSNKMDEKLDELDQSDKTTYAFARRMESKGLKVVGAGGGEKEGKTWLMEISFDTDRSFTISSGRKLMLEVANEYLKAINNDKSLVLSVYPFQVENISIGLFGKEVVDKQGTAVWIISLRDGLIYYSVDNPTGGRLIRVHEETFEEAVQKVKEEDPSK